MRRVKERADRVDRIVEFDYNKRILNLKIKVFEYVWERFQVEGIHGRLGPGDLGQEAGRTK